MADRNVSEPSTRSPIDVLLGAVVSSFERAFPGRSRGFYLHGSIADDTGLATSDVDLDVVVKGTFASATEQAAFERLARALTESSAIELDIELLEEAALLAGAEPTFKLGSRLLAGEDIRPRVPLQPVEDWGRERMFRGYYLLARVFDRSLPIRSPLGFPDPAAPFFGYTNRLVRAPSGELVPSTRNLIRVTGWLATALIAYQGKRYVTRKRDCHRLYREVFQDEWADVLDATYVTCRGRWSALIPGDPADRAELERICASVLTFENHFLACFKPFILSELRQAARRDGGTPSRASWLMREISFDDDEVRAALAALAH